MKIGRFPGLVLLLLTFQFANAEDLVQGAPAAETGAINLAQSPGAESAVSDASLDELQPHQKAASRFGVGFRLAFHNFPTSSAIGDLFQLYGDWVLPFQKWGHFILGGQLTYFPISDKESAIPQDSSDNFMAGLKFGYQVLWKEQQLFVPTLALEWDYYRFRYDTAVEALVTGSLISVSLGGMLNLGMIDQVTARDAYNSLGLSRAYLTFEYHPLSLNNGPVSISGPVFYSGIRLEFE